MCGTVIAKMAVVSARLKWLGYTYIIAINVCMGWVYG